MTIACLVCAAAVVLWLTGRPEGGAWWDFHPKPLEWKDRLTFAGAVAAGAGAAIALVVSYRKQRDTEEGRFAKAFADAAAQLGNESAAVRMAGAYALAALADRHSDRRQQCIDALCAYLRLKYTPEADRQNLTSTTINHDCNGTTSTDTITYRPGDREVRLTIIRIMRDHLQDRRAITTWCDHRLDFTDVTFDGGDFTGAVFADRVFFDGATFSGGAVSFVEAAFLGDVSFKDATFSGGAVSFNSAALSGRTSSFRRATFSGGAVSFTRAMLSGGIVSFEEARFLAGKLSFSYATFLTDGAVSFDEATFSGGAVSFDRAKFMSGAVFFDGATFSGGTVWSVPEKVEA